MRRHLDRAADGRDRGFLLRYARFHAKGCHRCGAYLRTLEEMISRLRKAKDVDDPAALERLSKKLDQAEH